MTLTLWLVITAEEPIALLVPIALLLLQKARARDAESKRSSHVQAVTKVNLRTVSATNAATTVRQLLANSGDSLYFRKIHYFKK